MNYVLATKNAGKLKELIYLLNSGLSNSGDNLGFKLSLAPPEFDPDENGKTFLENAIIKAKEAAKLTKLPSIAEDSGLEVEALLGRPGIHSARYCEGSDADRCKKILNELGSLPKAMRNASFVCTMVLSSPEGEILYTTSGQWKGRISFSERGFNGFGYDPIFCFGDGDKTGAELSLEEKNKLSHRGQAWRAMLRHLREEASRNSFRGDVGGGGKKRRQR